MNSDIQAAPWSKPEHVPGPVCWIKLRGFQHLVIQVNDKGIHAAGVAFVYWQDWHKLLPTYSTDRITWHPCTVPALAPATDGAKDIAPGASSEEADEKWAELEWRNLDPNSHDWTTTKAIQFAQRCFARERARTQVSEETVERLVNLKQFLTDREVLDIGATKAVVMELDVILSGVRASDGGAR